MKKKAAEKGVKLLLPVDNRIGDEFSKRLQHEVVPCGQIPDAGKVWISDRKQKNCLQTL